MEKKNIVLIGILGCGKSSLGKILAKRLSMTYVDMDELIEKEAQMSISEIFSRYGEEVFRHRETLLCHRLAKQEGLVISTGGGVVLREENMRSLSQNGLVLFIDRSPWTIIHTIDCSNRPLLKENPKRLFELYEARIFLYRKYAHIVFKNRGSLRASAVRLSRLLKDEPGFYVKHRKRHPSIKGHRETKRGRLL